MPVSSTDASQIMYRAITGDYTTMVDDASLVKNGLSDEQQRVVDAVVHADGGSIIGVRGYAGSGKTFTMTQALTHFERALVCAPTGAALDVLRRKFDADKALGASGVDVQYKTMAQFMQIPKPYYRLYYNGFACNYETTAEDMRKMVRDIAYVTDTHVADLVKEPVVSIGPSGRKKTTAPHVDIFTINQRIGREALTSEVEFIDRDAASIASVLSQYDVVVMDEASMVSLYAWERFVAGTDELHQSVELGDAADAYYGLDEISDLPVYVICGDDGQLPPVATAGSPAKAAQMNPIMSSTPDNESIFLLTSNYRSENPRVSDMAYAIRHGLKMPAMAGVIKDSISSDVMDLFENHPESMMGTGSGTHVVITFMNKTVREINEISRMERGIALKSGPVAGEPLICTRNIYMRYYDPETGSIDSSIPGEIMVANSQMFTCVRVVDVDEAIDRFASAATDYAPLRTKVKNVTDALRAGLITMIETNRDDAPFVFVPSDMKERSDGTWVRLVKSIDRLLESSRIPLIPVQLGYAITVHKSQGSEFDHVTYVVTKRHIGAQSRGGIDWKAPYTAITRAKKRIDVIYSESGSW